MFVQNELHKIERLAKVNQTGRTFGNLQTIACASFCYLAKWLRSTLIFKGQKIVHTLQPSLCQEVVCCAELNSSGVTCYEEENLSISFLILTCNSITLGQEKKKQYPYIFHLIYLNLYLKYQIDERNINI